VDTSLFSYRQRATIEQRAQSNKGLAEDSIENSASHDHSERTILAKSCFLCKQASNSADRPPRTNGAQNLAASARQAGLETQPATITHHASRITRDA
jgi:hypothetical protein